MNITCVSDTHRDYEKLRLDSGDLLVMAGDIDIWEELDIYRFSRWLNEQDFTYKVVIAGNHDKGLAQNPYLSNAMTAIYLNNKATTISGFTFWGSPITPTFLNWWFMADRSEIGRFWNMIPPKTDVIITHGPPYGILDMNREGQHCGCEKLLAKVKEIKPKYHIFGHIHQAKSAEKTMVKDGVTFINCSVLDEDYNLVNEPIKISLKKQKH